MAAPRPPGGALAEVPGVDDDHRVPGGGEDLGEVAAAAVLAPVLHQHGMVAPAVDDAILAEEHGPAPGVEHDQPRQGAPRVRRAEEVPLEAAPGCGVEGDAFHDQAVPLHRLQHLRAQVRGPRVAVQALQQAAAGLLPPDLEGSAGVEGPPAFGVQVEGAVGPDAPQRLLEAAVVAVGRAGEGQVAEAAHGAAPHGRVLNRLTRPEPGETMVRMGRICRRGE